MYSQSLTFSYLLKCSHLCCLWKHHWTLPIVRCRICGGNEFIFLKGFQNTALIFLHATCVKIQSLSFQTNIILCIFMKIFIALLFIIWWKRSLNVNCTYMKYILMYNWTKCLILKCPFIFHKKLKWHAFK